MRESLRLLEGRESLEAAKLEGLRARLDEAERDLAEGRLVTFAPGLLDHIVVKAEPGARGRHEKEPGRPALN